MSIAMSVEPITEQAATLFDRDYYLEINEARWRAAEAILAGLPGIRTCLDVGAGPGWFAEKLRALGYRVVGAEGRAELVAIARERVPDVPFSLVDVTDAVATGSLPKTDLVFCFGLLYHLENPFAAIRNFFALTGRHLLIETQILPGEGVDLRLVAEGKNATQGLQHHALIPTRRALVKMLKVAGFQWVWRHSGEVEHPDFFDTDERRHRREIFLATREAISPTGFVEETEPAAPKVDYAR